MIRNNRKMIDKASLMALIAAARTGLFWKEDALNWLTTTGSIQLVTFYLARKTPFPTTASGQRCNTCIFRTTSRYALASPRKHGWIRIPNHDHVILGISRIRLLSQQGCLMTLLPEEQAFPLCHHLVFQEQGRCIARYEN